MHEKLIAELDKIAARDESLSSPQFRAATALRQDAETIARLRKAIEDAPHDRRCSIGYQARLEDKKCTCWKKDALV